jgi:hypothetical protein
MMVYKYIARALVLGNICVGKAIKFIIIKHCVHWLNWTVLARLSSLSKTFSRSPQASGGCGHLKSFHIRA